jgi:phage FluMu gp28-like protein
MNMPGETFLENYFLPYQRRWLADPHPFKIGLWSRQSGKDFTCAAEAAIDALLDPGTHWVILACGERQAAESLQKVRQWLELAYYETQCMPEMEMRCGATEIRLANSSRITALPACAETIRGYSANVILTEFAFHPDAEEIWRAVFPTVSNPMRNGQKKLRVISTPSGHGNFFHDLWLNAPGFSKHKVTIHDAIADGLPLDLQQLREGIHNPEAWAQEYECEFLDQSSALLAANLIQSCESPEAVEHSTAELLSGLSGELFLGIDFGRKHDLTVCWMLERLGSQLWTREILVLDRASTPLQFEQIKPRAARARHVCLDYTGGGIGLGDLLAADFGEYKGGSGFAGGKIELCQFTAALKEELFPKMRASFERGAVRIPPSAAIREDLRGIHRVLSSSGRIQYRAANTADGHSDRATALALALRAAEQHGPSASASSVGRSFRTSLARSRIA